MTFINPYDILEIDTPDNSEVRKAKRKKLAEFELSDDGSIEYKNIKINKAEFLTAIDELDNEQKVQFYWNIKNNPELNDFLTFGDTWFFVNYKNQRIFSNPDFIEFVSPYFANKYNLVLLHSFKDEDMNLLKKLVAIPILVSPNHIDKAYQNLREFINNQIQELNQIQADIEDEDSFYDEESVDDVLIDLQEMINVNIYNALPAYFQSQRNDIAQKMRDISVEVFNNLNSSEEALKIIKFALQLNINNLTKQKLDKDFNQISDIHKERLETEKYGPLLIKYAFAIRQLNELIENIEKYKNKEGLISKVNEIINIEELNKQPEIFNVIRQQIAIILRNLSVLLLNEYGDHENSYTLIRFSQQINLNDIETKQQFEKDFNQISEIHTKYNVLLFKYNMLINIFDDFILNIKKIRNTKDLILEVNEVNVAELNYYPHLNLKREEFVYVLGNLSVTVYSVHKDFETAFYLIKFAQQINVSIKLKQQINDHERKLLEVDKKNSSSCYIATACYGDCNAPEVMVFRDFRDRYLLTNVLGNCFVSIYYYFSPFWAEKLKNRPRVNAFVRNYILNPIYKIIK